MATYYAAPNGSTSNTGSSTSPWLLHNAVNRLIAGDILIVKGGDHTAMSSAAIGVNMSGRNGTAANPILIIKAPGETPVLDCSAIQTSGGTTNYGLYMSGCNYVNIVGLTVKNVNEPSGNGAPGKGWELSNCNHIQLIQDIVNSCHQGFAFGGSVGNDYIYFTNCDAYENGDHYQDGGLCNGFNINTPLGTHIFFEGCRAWLNSDDGFDAYAGSGIIVFNRCWAFENGNWDGETGDGAGFKTGQVGTQSSGVVRTLTNCLSWDNNGIGFDEAQDNVFNRSVAHNIFNNVAYNNGDRNFNFGYVGGYTDVFRNNISYLPGQADGFGNNDRSNNSWQVGDAVSSGDFVTLNSAGAKGARGADGSLPVLNFLKLAAGSHLIGAGVDVNLDTDAAGHTWNATPSIGAYEYGSSSGRTQLLIEGRTYNNTVTGTWNGVEIPKAAATDLIFRNNAITSVNSGNYMLLAGGEEPLSSDNNLDGAVITGNKLTWNGSGTDLEGMQLGYNINQVVRWNYFDKSYYGVVFKSGNDSTGNMTNVSGAFAYNICKNNFIAVRVKGINGICIYNNTFYNDLHTSGANLINITNNLTDGGDASTGTKIYNNIFYTTHQITNISVEAGCESGFECDYNVYYCTAGTPQFVYQGDSKSFAQWQALGFDAHSIVVDPGFVDTTNFVPSARLDYGTSLGATWDDGLSSTAVWGTSSPSTAQQDSTWQVGARVLGSSGTIIPVTSLVIAGYGGATTITSRGGSLQILATILPANATNKVVKYYMVGTNALASINENTGVLTARGNGVVIIQAIAESGTGVSSNNLSITISNQVQLVPTVTTNAITGITSIKADGGNTLVSDGGSAIVARGVCWSTSINPTISSAKTVQYGTLPGSQVSLITNLLPDTTYYVRAYALNYVGTGYGANVSFHTNTVIIKEGGLIAHWPLDESSGTLVDIINAYNSSANTGEHGADGAINTCLEYFNGQYTTIAETAAFAVTPDSKMTICAWVYITSGFPRGIIFGDYNGPKFYLVRNGASDNYDLRWWATGQAGGTGDQLYEMNKWYFLAVVKDGSTVTFYRQGVVAPLEIGATATTKTPAGTYIGGSPDGECGNYRIDDVRIYDKALTAEEVLALYFDIPDEVIPVTAITVTGADGATSIDTIGGTLQMSAHVDPHDATYQDVVWRLSMPYGETNMCASIDEDGLLTALQGGSVEVTAQATDLSGITGMLLITITMQPSKNIAPVGWHVMTIDEWQNLYTELGGTDVAGGALKEAGIIHWDTPNEGATNSSGFSALPNGYRWSNDIETIPFEFMGKGSLASIWAASPYIYYELGPLWGIMAGVFNDNLVANASAVLPQTGAAIRCVKDSTTLTNGQTGTVTDIDGNIYPTICIGGKEFMAENLRVTKFNDGTPIANITDATAWGELRSAGMCFYENEEPVSNPIFYWGEATPSGVDILNWNGYLRATKVFAGEREL